MTTLIKNIKIIDGTGEPSYIGDVYIKEGKIESIGMKLEKEAKLLVDGTNKTLAPGFVDSHSHSDGNVLYARTNEVALFQGVTTTISGQCGQCVAPLCDEFAFWGNSMDVAEHYVTEKYKFDDLNTLQTFLENKYKLKIDLSSSQNYFDYMKKNGMSFNIAQLAGHNNLRAKIMGKDVMRPATDDEIKLMCELLKVELAHGCIGMSSGLDYYPGMFCETKELIELAKVLVESDAIYTTHVRIVQMDRKGQMFKGELVGILEAIDIARKTGVRLHISHVLPYNYHLSEELSYMKMHDAIIIKKIIENALEEGIRITYDVMTGETAGTDSTNLIKLFEPLVKEAGGVEAFQKKIESDEELNQLADFILGGNYPQLSMMYEPTVDDWIVITTCTNAEYRNKTIRVLSNQLKTDYARCLLKILKEDIHTKYIYQIACVKTEFLKEITDSAICFPSCDGYSFDVGETLGKGEVFDIGPSWLCYNFAVRFIKEFGAHTLEETIRRMTLAPMEAHGVKDRGAIKEGYYADLVIFDEDKLSVNQDYSQEKTSPLGIEKVFVNGILTVDNYVHTGALAGEFCVR